MIEAARLAVVVTDKGLDETQSKLAGFGDKLGDLGQAAQKWGAGLSAGVTAPLLLLGNRAVEAASDMNESMNKVQVVFGDAAGSVEAFAKTAATNLGMSQQAALEAAGTFGNLFSASGVAGTAAADMSEGILQLAADLGSFNNIDPGVMLEKLRSGLVGEVEPLRSVGILLTEATVKQKAMEMGLAASTEELTQADLVQARYALIVQQSSLAQGDFARTSDGLANSTRIMQAQMADTAATIGTQLLPVKMQLMQVVSNLLAKFQALSPGVQDLIVKVAALAAGIGPVLLVLGALMTALSALSAPILAVVAAVAALALAWQNNWGGIRDTALAVWAAIQPILTALQTALQAAVAAFQNARAGGEGALGALGTAFEAFAAKLGVLEQVKTWIAGVQDTWARLVEFFTPTIERLKAAFGEMIASFEPIGGKLQELWAAAEPILKPLAQLVGVTLVAAFNLLMEIVAAVMPSIGGIIGDAIDIAVAVLKTLSKVFTELVATVKALISGDWAAAWQHAEKLFRGLYSGLNTILHSIYDVFATLFGDLLQAVGNWLTNINGDIGRRVSEFFTRMGDVGRAMVDGLVNAIRNGAGAVLDALGGIVQAAIDAIKRRLGIGSPSKVFFQIGIDIIMGLIQGLKDKSPEALQAMAGILGAVGQVIDAIGRAAEWKPVADLTERLNAMVAEIQQVVTILSQLYWWSRNLGWLAEHVADTMQAVSTIAAGLQAMAAALADVGAFVKPAKLKENVVQLLVAMQQAVAELAKVDFPGMKDIVAKAGNIAYVGEALASIAMAWEAIGKVTITPNASKIIAWLVQVAKQIALAVTALQANGKIVFADTLKVFVDNLVLSFKPLAEAAKFAEQLAQFKWPAVKTVDVIAWLKSITGMVAQAVIALQNSKQWAIQFPAEFKAFVENLSQVFGPFTAAIDFTLKLRDFKWPDVEAPEVVAWLKSITGMVAQAVIALQNSKQWALKFPEEAQAFAANLTASFGPLSAALDFAAKLKEFKWPGVVAPDVIAWLKSVTAFAAKAMVELQKSKSWRLTFGEDFGEFVNSLTQVFGPLEAAINFAAKLNGFQFVAGIREMTQYLAAAVEAAVEAMILVRRQLRELGITPGKPFKAFIDSIKGVFGPLDEAVRFLTDLGVWQQTADLRQKFDDFLTAWRHILIGFSQIYDEMKDDVEEGMAGFAELIGHIASGLAGAIDLLSKDFSKVTVPAAEFWAPVYAWIKRTFREFEQWLRQNYPPTAEFGPVQAFGQAIQSLFGGLASALQTFSGLRDFRQVARTAITKFLDNVKQVFAEMQVFATRPEIVAANESVTAFSAAISALFGGLKAALDLFGSLSQGEMQAFLAGSRSTGSPFKRAMADLLESISGTLEAFKTYILGPHGGEWTSIGEAFLASTQGVFDLLKEGLGLFQELADSKMPTGAQLEGFMDMVMGIFEQFARELAGAAMTSRWVEAGKSLGLGLVQGMALGITSAVNLVQQAVQTMANAVNQTLQAEFQFGSPSKVMFGMGTQIGAGLALGIESTAGQVAGALGGLYPGLAGASVTTYHRYDLRVNGSALSPAEREELKRFLLSEMRRNR